MKHVKRMLWVIPLGFVVLGVIGQLLMGIGVIEENKSEKVKPKIEASIQPQPEPTVKKEAKFVGTFVRWAPASPATGTFYFMVENKGNKAGKFKCFIKMSDLIEHYKGYTQIEIDQDMPLGDTYVGAEPLVISNQGAQFVDQAYIECESK